MACHAHILYGQGQPDLSFADWINEE